MAFERKIIKNLSKSSNIYSLINCGDEAMKILKIFIISLEVDEFYSSHIKKLWSAIPECGSLWVQESLL